jgi:uncharacterized protein YjbJ (UPF0337 family)
MNELDLLGNWNQLKGTLKQRYGMLSDDDLTFVEGKGDELLGRLQEKLGMGREDLERVLNDLRSSANDAGEQVDQAKETGADVLATAKERVNAAAAGVKNVVSDKAADLKQQADALYEGASVQARAAQEQVEEYVRVKPLHAILAALAVGFVAGQVLRR